MKIFSTLYQKVLSLSKSNKAPYFLGLLAFIESSFFPIPPDILLVSMGLAKPKKVWRYAAITTIFSVVGGMFGYLIGVYALHLLLPFIKSSGYFDRYLMVQDYFKIYGVGFVLIAGFTPIPYKLFTIASGAMHMPFLPFVAASIIGRGARFYLVALLMFYQGEKIESHLTKHVEWLSWGVVTLLVVIYFIFKVF